ncbi:MAG: FAD-binding protein, partial [Defluviitaleaceae bacterium]|nr:FAD-binding protein [Defluviitaleaceae bacterium]
MDLRKLFSGSEFPPETLRFDEPLAPHTSFKIGGRADLMILPRTKEQLLDAFATLRENSIACFIMGGGNNLLVSDAGYRGVVIKTENMTGLNVSEREIHIEAGVSLARVFAEAAGASLTGFEFASGIPGSFG